MGLAWQQGPLGTGSIGHFLTEQSLPPRLLYAEPLRRRMRVRFADRRVWSNFAHLFSVSLIPATTEWIADSRLAAAPVVVYASVFVLVNITYLALCFKVVDRPSHEDITERMRRLFRMRSFITIGGFVAAALVTLKWPVVAMVLICLCLIVYLRPDIPAQKKVES
jgi:uncharacterized membrane protein